MSKGMHLIIHYNEIGLKGKNRIFFEKKLAGNIQARVKEIEKIERKFGKLVAKLKNEPQLDNLAYVPGISSFALAERVELKMEVIEKKALEILESKSFNTFRITAIRSNKLFKNNSGEINIRVGDVIRKKLEKKVSLDHPDLNLFIEISEKEAYLYTDKNKGVGGLPVGSSGKVVSLLSGGIDSPVASFLGMKRGLKIIFCHIQNKTMAGGREGAEKIKKIVAQLAKVQGKSKLYIVPFEEIQKAIISYVPAESRMIIYRRFMLKIAQEIAKKEKAKGIITGDCIGQVASQTIENLNCVYEGVDLPILPPLIGQNKEEIINLARKIGTYDLSIIPYPDCCSFLIAKHPETKARLEKIKELEIQIPDRDKLIRDCVQRAELEIFN